MLKTTLNPDPRYRRFYSYAVIGFAAMSIGYMLRNGMPARGGPVGYLLGLWPSLLGAFATPFVLLLILVELRRRMDLLSSLPAFGLIALVTLAGSLIIEAAHPLFRLGAFHVHDVLASVFGAAVAVLLFEATARRTPAR